MATGFLVSFGSMIRKERHRAGAPPDRAKSRQQQHMRGSFIVLLGKKSFMVRSNAVFLSGPQLEFHFWSSRLAFINDVGVGAKETKGRKENVRSEQHAILRILLAAAGWEYKPNTLEQRLNQLTERGKNSSFRKLIHSRLLKSVLVGQDTITRKRLTCDEWTLATSCPAGLDADNAKTPGEDRLKRSVDHPACPGARSHALLLMVISKKKAGQPTELLLLFASAGVHSKSKQNSRSSVATPATKLTDRSEVRELALYCSVRYWGINPSLFGSEKEGLRCFVSSREFTGICKSIDQELGDFLDSGAGNSPFGCRQVKRERVSGLGKCCQASKVKEPGTANHLPALPLLLAFHLPTPRYLFFSLALPVDDPGKLQSPFLPCLYPSFSSEFCLSSSIEGLLN
ncbi:uridine kinase [Striga asiatica]|uniref:Uridine kinase n=1 Tax=Striga asiatica TaxID=4170 RepID=A0A5A7Q1N0_STRAF|nr:uridine kinase [Striga asiatica]